MKKVCICGHFGFQKELLNGQTIKTKTIGSELEKQYGKNNIKIIDTAGNKLSQVFTLIQIPFSLINCKNIIIMPARNGVKVIPILITIFNKVFKRKLHYVVIGGWLPECLKSNSFLSKSLIKFDYIYVETSSMMKMLEEQKFDNVIVMPNFKNLNILNPEELVYSDALPLKLCTFSRVSKEKGIENAIKAVTCVNKKLDYIGFELDIYGQIDNDYIRTFRKLMIDQPYYIKYRGEIPFDKSTETLKNYFALLFPTYYTGEGFPGTLLDAMAAGVPVIASDWKYNSEIINDGYNGIVMKKFDAYDIASELITILHNKDKINEMKTNALLEAQKYLPDTVIETLTSRLI